MSLFQLTDKLIFPPATLSEDDGLLAIGGDLSPSRLLLAYSSGLFPWSNEGEPPLWWSPDPRCVFEPGAMRVSRSLTKTLRQGRYRVSYNQAFDQVIRNCAELRIQDGTGTWISPEYDRSFRELHRHGYAHSVECWRDDWLVGGVYGLCLGRCFFGESMFSRVANASKLCLKQLVDCGRYELIDCQLPTEHLHSLGAREIDRAEFEAALVRKPRVKPPREVVFDGAFEARLIALACSEAPSGYRRWTVRLLADKVVELNLAPSVSHMTVQRVLKKMNVNLTSKNTGKSHQKAALPL